MVTAREVNELLDERPDLEPAIEEVLDVEPPWQFQDVDVDSGRFGELVARNIVEETDEGYWVADPKAVELALSGDVGTDLGESRFDDFEVPFHVERLELALVLGAIAVVVGFRLVPWPTVFRDGHLVLSGNDPYFYRYLVERLLDNPNVTLSDLGFGVPHGEPLFVVSLWYATRVFGGTPEAAGHVLAWYPVLAAALTAGLVYAACTLVTDDRRVGLASIAMLAVLPAHALRTSLGFADHHAFDFLWLTVTLIGIVLVTWAVSREQPPFSVKTLAGVATISIGVTAQTLAWDNSPLIIAALAPYIALEGLRSVHRKESPFSILGPILVSLTIATGLVWVAHDYLGWHTIFVISAPFLMLIAGLGVVLTAELFHRLALPATSFAGVEIICAAAAIYGFKSLRPPMWARLLDSLETRLIAPRPIAEVQSIFSEAGGWLLLFGFILIISLPYLVWASYRANKDPRWLPLVVYAWYFLALSAIQARFVGELSPVIAIFAGLAFVHLAERIDIARRPAPFTDDDPPDLRLPDARQAGYLVALFLLVAGLSIVQVPVKTSQVTTPPQLSDTAFYLADRSGERDITYPDNYVFSQWDKNRVYNYFVSGESRLYTYARSNFEDFLVSNEPADWYDRLSGRAGYVVVTSQAEQMPPPRLGGLLYENLGSRTDSHSGLAHYRLIYVSESGEYKAFELVEGAVLQGQTTPNTTVEATTTVEVPGATFTYTRATTTNADGNYTLRVAHPGTYEIAGTSVNVTEEAVWNGTVVEVDSSA